MPARSSAGGGGGPRPARQRLDPGGEFDERERFGQVVVGAEPETGDAFFDRGGGGEHEDSGLGAGFDQRAAHVVPGHDR
jgi:hypothetical protein